MTYDIAIVGNGVLGCTTAFYLSLAEPGLRIALVGPRARPAAASTAAGAMLNLFAELEPDALRHPRSAFKFELGLRAKALWSQQLELLNGHAALAERCAIRPGTFIVNNTRSDGYDDRGFDAVVEAATTYGEPFEHVDPAAIEGYAPIPSKRALRAIYLREEGYIPSARLFRTLDAAVGSRQSIDRLDAAVVTLRSVDGAHRLELSTGGAIASGKVLLANGAAAQQLIDQLPPIRRRIPRLFYGVGCGVVLRPPVNLANVVRTNNRGLACGLHTVPDVDDGTCYVGASNFICQYPEYNVRVASIDSLLRAAMEEINAGWYKAQLEQVRVGHRPTSADLFPLIGPTSLDGLFILSGTKRDGLFMSPVYAREMCQSLLNATPCFGGRFSPERPLIATMTREEGIRKAVAHLWSGAYQHELRLPHAGWEAQVEQMLERRVLEAYEKSGNPDYGIPPEMLDMYRNHHVLPTEAGELTHA